MFKANKMRVLLILSMVLFVLFSSVNMLPARSFLDDIKRYSKRQGSLPLCDDPDFLCSNGSHTLLCGFPNPISCDSEFVDYGLYHNISCIIYNAKIVTNFFQIYFKIAYINRMNNNIIAVNAVPQTNSIK